MMSSSSQMKRSKLFMAVCTACFLVTAGCGAGGGGGASDDAGMDVQQDVQEDASDVADTAPDTHDAADTRDIAACQSQEEQCNGEDDNCNEVVDEGCGCNYDQTETGVCSNGTIGSNVGECQAPENYESDESSCDGVDNDCDGMVDEGCPCNFDGTSKGVCSNGTKSPEDGSCQEPENYISGTEDGFQNKDHCDGFDNDCNGAVDEGCPCNFANLDVGVCGNTTRGYIDGSCQKPSAYQDTETICDGKDNDCNGEVDESCSCTVGSTESCYTGPAGTADVGACASGEHTCQKDGDDASFGECMNETLPTGENCTDGIDNDCDGKTDMADMDCKCMPGNTQSCYTGPSGTQGVGVCASGTQTCQQQSNGSDWGPCMNETLPSGEDCTDGKDNDCDGDTDMADSACTCTIGTTQSCYTGPSGTKGVGACSAGQETCQQGSDGTKWSSCQNQTLPSVEACGDNTDNDCDGQTDESGSVFEDFEGSDSGWSKFNNGTGTVNTSTSASTAYNGSEAGKAQGPNQGVCGVGGLSKSFNFTQVPTSMTVWVKATSGNWGRVSIMLQDSTGITPIWVNKASGSALNMSWTKKTFDPSMHTNDSNFTLIFGNNDNSSYCTVGDHDWTLWFDDLELQQPSCSSP